jgi:hypothetical protein
VRWGLVDISGWDDAYNKGDLPFFFLPESALAALPLPRVLDSVLGMVVVVMQVDCGGLLVGVGAAVMQALQ